MSYCATVKPRPIMAVADVLMRLYMILQGLRQDQSEYKRACSNITFFWLNVENIGLYGVEV